MQSTEPPVAASSRRRVLALAWPVMLAQAATATTGVVDTGLMARFGDKADLAAVGIASVSFSFLYWAFGFLRMSTTGLTAQAEGANDPAQARAHLVRALGVGAAMGLLLVVAFVVVGPVVLGAFDAEADVESLAAGYFRARIWGAPAALMGYAIMGWLLGMGRTRSLLAYQVVLSGLNSGLDVWLAGALDLGPAGIGLGTALAEWAALGVGLWQVRAGLRRPARLLDRRRIVALFAANRDILIRTLALLLCFGWFVRSSTKVGTATVAGNEVLLQFVAVSAFVLDAFAFVAEREVGQAIGARDPARLRRALRVTTELAAVAAVVFSLGFWLVGGPVIDAFVTDSQAREVAREFLPWCAAVPMLGVLAWQLDGAFLGATLGAPLRNAALASTVLYVSCDLLLSSHYGNTGIWIAFCAMYVFRAATLGAYGRRLVRAASEG